jgi:hypothetical protein
VSLSELVERNGQAGVREDGEQHVQRRTQLQRGELGADAVVRAGAEREVRAARSGASDGYRRFLP